ncbi:Uu.00g123810.m01.CDS01 [Anthostomella pinea]|uniref:Uu.00g123810.m01.CDS01 n=1 Tax=Anthostomella pinea TaxID=933095 RepID=A0AAI8VC66_9PEZI|nr:Uu.00g123810.m01.CDS01 [Anthostomella pinea]
MGSFCSVDKGPDPDQHEKDSEEASPRPVAIPPLQHLRDKITGKPQQSMTDRMDNLQLDFQGDLKRKATDAEKLANEKLQLAKKENESFLKQERHLKEDERSAAGDHFTRNADFIDKTSLLKYAHWMPKAAHLHIHFNSTLLPEVLLGYAKNMPNMFMWSSHKLLTPKDYEECGIEFMLGDLLERYKDKVGSMDGKTDDEKRKAREATAGKLDEYDEVGPNVFTQAYNNKKDHPNDVQQMRYAYFRKQWEEKAPKELGSCDEWLKSKLVSDEKEINALYAGKYEKNLDESNGSGTFQWSKQSEDSKEVKSAIEKNNYKYKQERMRARIAWERFDGRTRMMKGLFNYETAYRAYTRQCLEEFVRDNVQYAEIRPNFMATNQILRDDGSQKINNQGTVDLIIDVYQQFMKDIGDMNDDNTIVTNPGHRPTFSGLKIIYCTPRSFNKDAVGKALSACRDLAIQKKYRDYIAGFDLIGEEAFGRICPLWFFKDEFQRHQTICDNTEGLDVPFLFHCGETPDDKEGNLECALNFGSRRIGHGYALPEKPEILQQMKAKGVCVETCPISNMVLGLTERMDQHAVYRLLDANMHCAVSSDNGTLFRSTLSHDFYEVMAGHKNMNLYGWKQLAKWSLTHSCMSDEDKKRAEAEWVKRWEEFIKYVNSGQEKKPDRLLKLEQAQDKGRERAANGKNYAGVESDYPPKKSDIPEMSSLSIAA